MAVVTLLILVLLMVKMSPQNLSKLKSSGVLRYLKRGEDKMERGVDAINTAFFKNKN